LDQQIACYTSFQDRIAQRQTYQAEYDYYLAKLEKLQAQRDKQLATQKEQSASDNERYERNINKAKVAEQRFKDYNYAIVSEFNNLWGRRVTIIGPALLEFVNAERRLTQLQKDMLEGITTQIDAEQANRDFMQNYNELLPAENSQSTNASLVIAESGIRRPGSIQAVPAQNVRNFGDESPLDEDVTMSSSGERRRNVPNKSELTKNLEPISTPVRGDFSSIAHVPGQSVSGQSVPGQSVGQVTTTEFDKSIVGDRVIETRKDETMTM